MPMRRLRLRSLTQCSRARSTSLKPYIASGQFQPFEYGSDLEPGIVVLGFLKSEALHPADFTIREDGVVRLNPELARRVAQLAV